MIESVNNERIKKYSKLLNKKYRDETGLYLVSTDHLVSEALKKDLVVEIFLLDGYENKYGNVTYVSKIKFHIFLYNKYEFLSEKFKSLILSCFCKIKLSTSLIIISTSFLQVYNMDNTFQLPSKKNYYDSYV